MTEGEANRFSGSSVTVPQCPKCDKRNAHGTYFVREMDGRHIFKCDHCGQMRSMGWSEASHLLMVEQKDDYQHASDNRSRWRREFQEKFQEDYEDAVKNVQTTPDAVENFDSMMLGLPKTQES